MIFGRIYESNVALAGITDTTSRVIDLDGSLQMSVQCLVTVNTGAANTIAADTGVDIATDQLTTATAHGYFTGLKVRFTSTGTLPAGLATSTDYFVIAVSASVFAVGSSLANAQAGTKVNITDTGTAASTITVTPTAIAGASVILQKSNDGVNYDDIGSATAITVSANVWLSIVDPTHRWARLKYVITAGSMSTTNNILVKGWANIN